MEKTAQQLRRDDPSRVILDSISDGVFTVDEDWRVTSFNRAAEEITGVSRQEAVGSLCNEVFRANICETRCALRQTMATGEPVVGRLVYVIDASGERVPISVSTGLFRDEDGRVIGGVETFRDLSLSAALREGLDDSSPFPDIVSRNQKMRRLFEVLPAVADSESTVLIDGESGTGKELIATAIHHLSPRRDRPMIAVNCGALPDTLLESELFGHVAGAFTDARTTRQGRFAQANGGTLFLDEIGDVSPALQVRLLRVLQEQRFEPVGSDETVSADVRVIAATNQSLEKLVKMGDFRQDLYYRVNVVQLRLPALRERPDDVPLLVDHFVEQFRRRRDKEISGVTPEVMHLLTSYDYPGNVRELENIIEHGFVMCPGGLIDTEHLPAHLSTSSHESPGGNTELLGDAERSALLDTLERCDWHRARAAEALEIHPSTLWRKMKRLGITPPARDGRFRSSD